jgi:hypothetical protein
MRFLKAAMGHEALKIGLKDLLEGASVARQSCKPPINSGLYDCFRVYMRY